MRQKLNISQIDNLAQNLKFQSHNNYDGIKNTNAKNIDNKSKAILHNNKTFFSFIEKYLTYITV